MHPRKTYRNLGLLALLSLAPAAALAAPTVTQEAEDMVVTASRTERRAIDVPITTEVIGAEDIQLTGAIELGDVLSKRMTGHFHKYNGLLSPIGIRGFQTESHGDDIASHVLILIDGHRVGTGNAAKINMDRIERIEIIKGPASALYGSAAMGGVVNLITKKGDGPLGGSVGIEYGSFDFIKGLATAGGEVNEKIRFFASASADHIGDYDTPDFGTVYNTEVDKATFGGNVIFSPSENHEFRLGGNYAHLPGEYPSSLNRFSEPHYNKDYRANFDKSTGYADLEYNGDYMGGVLHWRSMFYYLHDKNHWFSGAIDPNSNQTKYIDKTLGTDQQFTWKMSEWNTLLGGFLVESMEKESYGVSDFRPAAPYTPGMTYDNQALFVQDSLDLWDNRVNIVAAGRYDRFELETKRAKTGTYDDFKERSEDFSHFSPKLGADVKFLDERLRLRGNLGQGFKSPTADQLSADYYSASNGVRYLGNPNLDPETSLTYGLGADLFLDAFTVKVDWYHTDYEDKIVQLSSTRGGENVSTYDNHGDATIGGLDLLLEWQIDRTFEAMPFSAKLWSNMSFIFENEDEQTGTDLNYISDYEIKSGLDLGFGDFGAQLSYVYVGPQMVQNWDNYPATIEEKGGFGFWDLTMSYTFAKHWEVRAGVYNVFDQNVEWVQGYPMAERNYRVGLTYKF